MSKKTKYVLTQSSSPAFVDAIRKQDCLEYARNTFDAQIEMIRTGVHPTKLPYVTQRDKFNEIFYKAIDAGLTPFDLFHAAAGCKLEAMDEDYLAWLNSEDRRKEKTRAKQRAAYNRKKIVQMSLIQETEGA